MKLTESQEGVLLFLLRQGGSVGDATRKLLSASTVRSLLNRGLLQEYCDGAAYHVRLTPDGWSAAKEIG